MGPRRAAEQFRAAAGAADRFVVTLYGSLAATGKGHLTDQVMWAAIERGIPGGGCLKSISVVRKPAHMPVFEPQKLNMYEGLSQK